MKLFKDYTLTWWQVGLLKLCVYCIGISIGAYWSEIFLPYIPLLLIVGGVTGAYLAFVWFKE